MNDIFVLWEGGIGVECFYTECYTFKERYLLSNPRL